MPLPYPSSLGVALSLSEYLRLQLNENATIQGKVFMNVLYVHLIHGSERKPDK